MAHAEVMYEERFGTDRSKSIDTDAAFTARRLASSCRQSGRNASLLEARKQRCRGQAQIGRENVATDMSNKTLSGTVLEKDALRQLCTAHSASNVQRYV